MLIFYHLEKTAGSSFRKMCVDYFGANQCEGLYGPNSKSTSEGMRAFSRPGPHRAKKIAEYLMRQQPNFFSTHFIKPVRNHLPSGITSVAFFRDPAARLVSHYNHWRQQGHFEGSFKDFLDDEKFSNWQSKRFTIQEMENVSIVGLTERFDESVSLINARLDLKLKRLHTNKTRKHSHQVELTDLDAETRRMIDERNTEDAELYKAVCERFERDQAVI